MPAYFLRITIFACFILTFLPDHLVSAADASMTITAQYRQDVPVTLDIAHTSEISLDPALVVDSESIGAIENLFLGLTDFDPVSNTIEPELATHWTISADGLTWTFTLRNDVMWRHYDPLTQTATPIRPVVASDFVYSIKRACDWRLAYYYGAAIAARVIAGCDVINTMPSEALTDDLIYGDTTQVTAPNDTTLVIILREPASYFLSMTTMPILRAVPQETVETHGDKWTLPGSIVTNGPYFVQEITRGLRSVFVRNPELPSDLAGTGNIEKINITVYQEDFTPYAIYREEPDDYFMDSAAIPAIEIAKVLEDQALLEQVKIITGAAVFYFAFAHDKPPFDNVHVRRAFSAIIDRQAFLEQIGKWRGVPMIHFTPPSMFGAPPIDEIGVGFNPEYARQEMALAGYADCQGLPPIQLLILFGGTESWADFWATAAQQHLGCDLSTIKVKVREIQQEYIPGVAEAEKRRFEESNVVPNGWGGHYPDAHSWTGDMLSCHVEIAHEERYIRPCTATDDLIDQAARETDPAIRADLYRQIEEAFFGPDGEFPIAPLYLRANYILVKSWYTGPFETDTRFGVHWEAYSIDMAAKLAARAAQ